MRRTRYLPLYVPSDVYKRLEQAGIAEERDVLQQARWILKRALEEPTADRVTSHAAREVVA